MQRVLMATALIILFCAACSIEDEAPFDARLLEAQQAFDEGQRLKTEGQYVQALPFVERARELRESVLGSAHPALGDCLELLGDLHRRSGDYVHAEPLLQRALAIGEAALGKDHLRVAHFLNSLASLYMSQGLYTRAEPLYERALAIREAALGMHHPDVAASLNNLATLYEILGLYERAESLHERALAIWETALARPHPHVTPSFNDLAALYETQGLYERAEPLHGRLVTIREAALGAGYGHAMFTAAGDTTTPDKNKSSVHYERAEPLYVRALAIREAALGKHHPGVAQSLNNLATLYWSNGHYGRALPLYERALGIREATLGKRHPDVAQSLNNLANLYWAQGLYAQAEPLYERALAIGAATLALHHPDIATALNNLATLYSNQGHYRRAEPLHERALAIREATLGRHHPGVAQSLNNLASLYKAQGLYGRAEPLYEHALTIGEAALGKHHPDVATTLHNLATVYDDQGHYGRAGPLYERVLTMREAALGKHHPDVATTLNSLATLYTDQGHYGRAESLHERALAIREAALGKHHPDVATTLDNLASIYKDQGHYGRAEPLYKRALAIREAKLDRSHPDVATTLNNLATLYWAQGAYRRAEWLYERALAIYEEALGKHHPAVATTLNNLATLYWSLGDYGRAERMAQRALAIYEEALGEHHPNVILALNNLAWLRLAQQQHLAKALPLFKRAFAASEEHLRQEVYGFSEARLTSVLRLLRADEERLYMLGRSHPDNVEVRRLALTAALLRKGRSVEEISNTSRIIYRGLGQEERATFERLRALRTQLSIQSLVGPGKTVATYQQRIKELAEQGDALEAELARRSAPLRALRALPPPSELINHVAAALPRDGALVEFVVYCDTPLVPKLGSAASQAPSQLRYLALLLFADGRTQALDLGPAAPIDGAALRLQAALAGNAASHQPAAQALYQLAFRPLVPLLGKVQRLFISPDGQLSLIPFAALHDGRRFLADAWDITYLTSGKELLPRSEDIPPGRSVMVLADPDFGSVSEAPLQDAQTALASAGRSVPLERFFSSLRADFADRPLPPLPGTRKEAEAIQRLFPEAQLLLGRAATKDALLKLPTPDILHIATHGFFLKAAAAPVTSRAVAHFGAESEASPVRLPPDPLLRSGLVLAGARAPAAAPSAQHIEDSLVTALELAGLDLWGTQLVVLSACDTGRGDIKLGQGVYGLRRALVVAGAETVVASLWKVNDETTQELMEAYYRHLLAGHGRTTALRQAMLELRQKWPHPHYWAPFIAIGRDAPLRRLTPPTVARQTP